MARQIYTFSKRPVGWFAHIFSLLSLSVSLCLFPSFSFGTFDIQMNIANHDVVNETT